MSGLMSTAPDPTNSVTAAGRRPAWAAARVLAPYATDPARSRGRLHPEQESRYRSPFQRDRDRIIHCSAFKRLRHKTQVFVYDEGDYYRSRLTHTMEVAQIARTISRALGLDEDLAEAIALAHDFGHTPFGHAGEEALDAVMADFGGFDHNAQTLRILTKLERRYAEFDGLNLTWETLEGVVKHNGPLLGPTVAAGDLPTAVAEYAELHDLELATFAGPEAQVAAIADDIAYNSHDLDDGLRAELFQISDLQQLPIVGDALREVRGNYPDIDAGRLVHETVRRIIGTLVEDVLAEAGRRIADLAPQKAEDVRAHDAPVIALSDPMARGEQGIKAFLFTNMYRHERVNKMTDRARRVVDQLFHYFMQQPGDMPDEWQRAAQQKDQTGQARVIADYIAGMTDGYALAAHGRLVSVGP